VKALDFVKTEIVLADGRKVGAALGADPWIADDLLAPAFERDEAGLPQFRLFYAELPRGHWKSGGAAAIAVTEAVLESGTDVVIAAADRDQAAIVGENVDGYLSRNAKLRALFDPKRDEWLVPSRGSRIRVISSDAPTAWGLGGTHKRFRVVCDELTNWREQGEALWIALASATGKVADAQTIVITNAGYDADHSWQWRVRESAEREGWALLLTVDGVLASWITDEWIEQMRALLPGAAFDRAILNKWVAESGDFVTREQWRRCVDPGLSPQTQGIRELTYIGGLDLGLTKDRTAFAIVHVDRADGQTIVLDELQVWAGTRAKPVEIAQIERAVVDAKRRYSSLRVLADPWQLKGSIQRLSKDGVSISEFTFSAGSIAKLSSLLYELISDATLRVFDDRELEQEILGLQVVQTASGWRIDHRSGGYSDRAVALGMALSEAVKYRRSGTLPPLRAPDGSSRAISAGIESKIF
jgi:phage terminase large subunit-like protein